MAGEIVAARLRRQDAAELIDAVVLGAATAPIWVPMVRDGIRKHRQGQADASKETHPQAATWTPPSRQAVLKWLFMPHNPLPETAAERWLALIALGYETVPPMLWGRTPGQRAMGLRTVTARDGTRPGLRMLAGTLGLRVLRRSQPDALRFGTAIADLGTWMITRPRRPWRHRLIGIVVVDDPGNNRTPASPGLR
ncbi:RDD family protein [Actinomadura alba]|uniref:RDD family protein n=1 Tax=Actinomadura alba TaxID=406431 RepID=A0ABR7LVG3_9ACTN|nr:RDD family protein [Actinomadura alba]MBC6468663.1 RDD family protein [Actinomadura alba]